MFAVRARVDASVAARQKPGWTFTFAIDAALAGEALFSATTAIQRVRERVHTGLAARQLASRTNAFGRHAGAARRAAAVTLTAMRAVTGSVDARAVAGQELAGAFGVGTAARFAAQACLVH